MQRQVKSFESFERSNFGSSYVLAETDLKDLIGGEEGFWYYFGQEWGKDVRQVGTWIKVAYNFYADLLG